MGQGWGQGQGYDTVRVRVKVRVRVRAKTLRSIPGIGVLGTGSARSSTWGQGGDS